MNTLKVVTFNIQHGQGNDNRVDIRRTARVLSMTGGELTGLQEADKYTPRSGFIHQPGYLGRLLRKYWAFGANIQWMQGMEYGNAILSRWPLFNYRNHLLPGRGEQRGILEAETAVNGSKVQLLCTHLGLEDEDRAQQVERIMEITSKIKGPTILLGDFNHKRDSREFKTLSASFHEATGTAGGFNTFPSTNPAEQPDFIFLSGHWNTISAKPVYSDASDHLAVVAEIELI